MNKLFFFLLPLTTFGQKIQVEKATAGPHEITLTRPAFSARPEPVPAENGLYRFTHFMAVECTDAASGETIQLNQYININNGVVGIFGDDIAKVIPEAASSAGGKFDYWAILPNMTQRYFITSPETGKMMMQHTAGDGMRTKTMARFDAWNEGELFWQSAKKVYEGTNSDKTTGKQSTLGTYAIYEANGPEGKVFMSLKDLGPATGQYAPLTRIYSAVGMGGQGLILNDKTKHIHLVFTISDATRQSGCRLTAFYPKTRQFSGAGYKAMGDMLLPKLSDRQREQQQAQQQQQAEDNQEEDTQLRALLAQQRKLQAELQKKAMDGMTNAALFNDVAEISRTANRIATETDNEYHLANIQLSIDERRLQIQLNNMQGEGAAEERARIRRKMACIPRQRDIYTRQRSELNALRKKYPLTDGGFQYIEKAGEVKARYMNELIQSCPE